MTTATFTEAGAFVDLDGEEYTHGQFLAPIALADAARAAGWLVADMGQLISLTKLAADEVPEGMVRGPFTAEQRNALAAWQSCGWVHQMTCDGDADPDGAHHASVPMLVEVAGEYGSCLGLVCPVCGRQQRDVPQVCLGDLPANPAELAAPGDELVLTPEMAKDYDAGGAFEQLAIAHGATVTRIDPDAEQRLTDSGLRFLKVTSPPGAQRPEALLVDGVVYWPEGSVQ